MSALVKYSPALAVVRGLYPAGTTAADFVTVDDEALPGYIVANFTGTLEEAQALGMEVCDPAELETSLIELSSIQVTPLETGFLAKENEFNIKALTAITATAAMSKPGQPGEKFRVPILRTDTNRKDYLVGEVDAGGESITITGQFATGGQWITNNALINEAFEQPLFDMPELTFMVL